MGGFWILDGDCDEKFEDFSEIFDYIRDNTCIYDDYESDNFDDELENQYDYWDLVDELKNGSWDRVCDSVLEALYDRFYEEFSVSEGDDCEFDDGTKFVWVEEEEEEEEETEGEE